MVWGDTNQEIEKIITDRHKREKREVLTSSEISELEDTISDLEMSLDHLDESLHLANSKRRREERAGRALSAKIQELQQSKLLIEEKIREAKHFLGAVRTK